MNQLVRSYWLSAAFGGVAVTAWLVLTVVPTIERLPDRYLSWILLAGILGVIAGEASRFVTSYFQTEALKRAERYARQATLRTLRLLIEQVVQKALEHDPVIQRIDARVPWKLALFDTNEDGALVPLLETGSLGGEVPTWSSPSNETFAPTTVLLEAGIVVRWFDGPGSLFERTLPQSNAGLLVACKFVLPSSLGIREARPIGDSLVNSVAMDPAIGALCAQLLRFPEQVSGN